MTLPVRPINDRLITGFQIIGKSPTPRNRKERINEGDPPLLFGIAVAPKAFSTTNMQPKTPPDMNHNIPKENGPLAKAIIPHLILRH